MRQREWLEAALESFACSLFKDGYRYCGFYSSASNTLAQAKAGLFKFADNPMSKVAAQIKRGERQEHSGKGRGTECGSDKFVQWAMNKLVVARYVTSTWHRPRL